MAATTPTNPRLVCVTGANGFVATELTRQLLAKGYHVRATVRGSTLANAAKVAHLTALRTEFPDATLELVAAELLDDGAFDAVVQGCFCVMHTASPYTLNVKDPVKDLIEPAVNGTLNVLRAAANAHVPHVVVTSSMAAVTDSPKKGHVYTEADWNEESSETRNPYYASKVRAEKAAWAFVEERAAAGASVFRLVTINPFLIIGPEPGDGVNTSNAMFKDVLEGKYPALMDLSWCFVDVRDVARAHVLALERPEASGRFVLANDAIHMKDVVAILRHKYPEHKLPKRNLSCRGGTALTKLGSYFQPKGTGQYLRTNLGRVCLLDCTKARTQLGMTFMPVAQSIIDTTEDLRTHNKLACEVTAVAATDIEGALAAAAAEPSHEDASASAADDTDAASSGGDQ